MTNSATEEVCRVCRTPAEYPGGTNYGRNIPVQCPRCGNFRFSGTAWETVGPSLGGDPFKIAKVSLGLRRMQESKREPLLTSDLLTQLVEGTELPLPREQADNIILWLGKSLRGRTGGRIKVPVDTTLVGVMGATTAEDAYAVIQHLQDKGLLNVGKGIGLTLEGWDRFHALEHATVESRIAFMAMPFGDQSLDRIFRDCFKPAVQRTGFDLRRIDESPPAGLIDHRLRVEIRRARFLIAELTGGNHGAYWEAGFAEGLGRPVIFTCSRTYFEAAGTHFDTNHCQTIVWSEEALDEAAKQLKATIRATLPAEALPPSDDEG